MAAILDDSVAALTRDLYAHYGSQIYTYCYRRLRSREEAEDTVRRRS